MFFNDCYKRSVVEQKFLVQFKFYSIHLILFMLLIKKIYIYWANPDELEVILLMDLIKMIEFVPNLNLIHISLILNAHCSYHTFYIAIDDYYRFHLNSVLNDDSMALFGSYYVYKGHLATKYIRMKMLNMLDLFYFADLISGL